MNIGKKIIIKTNFVKKLAVFMNIHLLQDKLVEEIFSHEDKDKDGLISHDEFSGPKHDEL